MTARTHQRAGLLCGLLTQQFLVGEFYLDSNLNSKLFVISIFCLSTTIGSLLPDIDKPGSQIGSFFPILSRLIARNFKHRTVTHSLLSIYFFIFLLSLAPTIEVGSEFFTITIIGLMIGHISHILLDLLTIQGVCLFYPLKKKTSVANFKTGGLGEKVVNHLLRFSTVGYLLYVVYHFTI